MITAWLARWRARRRDEIYQRGYDWAAGLLLANQNADIVDYIDDHTIGEGYPFDAGAQRAIHDYERLRECRA